MWLSLSSTESTFRSPAPFPASPSFPFFSVPVFPSPVSPFAAFPFPASPCPRPSRSLGVRTPRAKGTDSYQSNSSLNYPSFGDSHCFGPSLGFRSAWYCRCLHFDFRSRRMNCGSRFPETCCDCRFPGSPETHCDFRFPGSPEINCSWRFRGSNVHPLQFRDDQLYSPFPCSNFLHSRFPYSHCGPRCAPFLAGWSSSLDSDFCCLQWIQSLLIRLGSNKVGLVLTRILEQAESPNLGHVRTRTSAKMANSSGKYASQKVGVKKRSQPRGFQIAFGVFR